MGAATFVVTVKGDDAGKAFRSAVDEAAYEYGHGGYSGTIAEKSDVVMFELPAGVKRTPEALADFILNDFDPDDEDADELADLHPLTRDVLRRIHEVADDKWGPAAGFRTADGFVFFGWASS